MRFSCGSGTIPSQEAAWRCYSAQRDQDAFADLPFTTQSFPHAIFSSLAARDLALNRMARLGEPRERLMAAMGIAGAATRPETWGRIFESTAGFDSLSRQTQTTVNQPIPTIQR